MKLDIYHFYGRMVTKLDYLLYKYFGNKGDRGNRVHPVIWNNQYKKNTWNYLNSALESEHYECICAFIEQVIKNTTEIKVLDVGCGQGVLIDYLTKKKILHKIEYTGIDISEEAIKLANRLHPTMNFIVQDFEKEEGTGPYDLIILNEVLYYFSKPLNTLKSKFRKSVLKPEGHIIVSMCDGLHVQKIFISLIQILKRVDTKIVSNERGQRWTIGWYILTKELI